MVLVSYQSRTKYLALEGIYLQLSTPVPRSTTLERNTVRQALQMPNGAVTLPGSPFQGARTYVLPSETPRKYKSRPEGRD